SLMARSYLAWGEALAEPRMGAVAVFSRGSDPALGHVGFWLGESDGDVVLLGGNQGNQVSVVRYSKERLIGLRWPHAGAPSEEVPQAKDNRFADALDHVLEMEGGFTDDPHDPGGPTNLGITLAVFAAWRKTAVSAANRARLIRDLKAIDRATVTAIYRTRYWDAAHCDALPAPIAFMHFDAAVNHGVGTAIRCLQEALGVSIDGEVGPETRAAAARASIAATLDAYAAIRERRYRALPHFWRFGRGWLRRVDVTLSRARAALDTHRETSNTEQGDADMNLTPSMPSDGKWWGHSLTIWGTIVTVLSSVLPALAPVTGIDVTPDLIESAGRGVVETVQAVGALIGTLLTIYGRVRADQPIQRVILKPKR
ncbi:glycosyl hydrolase 108 family protein, partial [uncultured Hyphomicrobium sp.]|uniref:glycosyl hydrolase 108 family protein n=1 Tax=uncultured Hyphomicrobium sp. TaxID=194373 RepID=UPI0025FCD7C7